MALHVRDSARACVLFQFFGSLMNSALTRHVFYTSWCRFLQNNSIKRANLTFMEKLNQGDEYEYFLFVRCVLKSYFTCNVFRSKIFLILKRTVWLYSARTL